MQEKVLEQLKIKYEYLDFDNAIVLTCFHNAVEEFKRENSAAFDNANIAGLELEHYFLYYLVLEMQKGNQEIYDAVSIGMEYINDFVIRRRKDLVSSFNKEQQKAFYDEAFKNTINGYYKKMSLTSALTQNLLQVYNVAKEGYKEVSSMKYNLKLKSIYEVFSEYDVDILKTVLKAFQKEGMSYRVLVKKYGKNLDGEGAASFLTYADSSKLERILSRIESWLIYAQYLYNKEDSLDSIYQFFNKTSDEKLVHILTNYQKKTEEKVNLFSSKNDIMTKYQISEEILSDSLEFVEDKKYRILYKYTYGINCKKMKKESILDMLGINLDLYQRGLLMVQKQLPTLISKAKKSLEEALPQGLENNTSKPKKPSLLNHETKEQPKPIPNNIANDVMTDTSKQEKKEEPVKIIEDEPIKSKKKNKQYLKQYFIEYLYTEGMTEEEKQNLSKRLSSILDKLKKNNAKGFEILEKLYGPNLDQPLSDYFVPKNKKSLFYSFIHSTQRLLSVEYKNRMAKKVTSKKELKQDFKDYFYKEGMSQEEKDQVMEKLTKALLFNQNSTAYQILYKLYDENLLLKKDVEASKNEKISITKFIKRLSKDMEADLDILLKQSKKAKRPTSFFEYFYEEGMSQEEKEEIKEKILLFLKESTLASVDIIYKLYGENLDTLNKNAEISKSELANLSYLKSSIKKYLISGHIRSKSNRPSTFFEYFYEEGMTEEEKEL